MPRSGAFNCSSRSRALLSGSHLSSDLSEPRGITISACTANRHGVGHRQHRGRVYEDVVIFLAPLTDQYPASRWNRAIRTGAAAAAPKVGGKGPHPSWAEQRLPTWLRRLRTLEKLQLPHSPKNLMQLSACASQHQQQIYAVSLFRHDKSDVDTGHGLALLRQGTGEKDDLAADAQH